MATDSGRSPADAWSGCQPSASAVPASLSGVPNAARIIDIAVAIAAELGDDFDAAPYNKTEWIKARGGEPFRDVNLPFQCDYLAAASVAARIAKELK